MTCQVADLVSRARAIESGRTLTLGGVRPIGYDPSTDLVLHRTMSLPFHPNGLRFTAVLTDGTETRETYYSVGGGFIVQEDEKPSGDRAVALPFPIGTAAELAAHCRREGCSIPAIVRRNELGWRTVDRIDHGLERLRRAMEECVRRGCHTDGTLPGGLAVRRRAHDLHDRLMAPRAGPALDDWLGELRSSRPDFQSVIKWVSAFALAVNEENAAFGRVVTAPTNGAAGVIPAVMMYYECFTDDGIRRGAEGIADFLLTTGEIGSLFKKGATISAAQGGCQAGIGVSSGLG